MTFADLSSLLRVSLFAMLMIAFVDYFCLLFETQIPRLSILLDTLLTIVVVGGLSCKDTVIENENGFLVEPRNVQMLTQRMVWFIKNSDAIERMGVQSRRMAAATFSVEIVNRTIVDLLLRDQSPADVSSIGSSLNAGLNEVALTGWQRST